MRKLYLYNLSVLITTIFFYFVYENITFKIFKGTLKIEVKNRQNKYSKNHEFVINYNIAQYSSYVIYQKDTNAYRIEAFVHFNSINNVYSKNFICILKISEKLIKLKATDMPRFRLKNKNMKLVFDVETQLAEDLLKLNIGNVLVAVIWKYDFDINLNLNEFMNSKNLKKPIVLPYSLIKFQKPTIIEPVEPRLPSVSLCVHYVYSMPPQLKTWIDIHLDFGVKEIMIYDATEESEITKFFENEYKNDNRITVRPYKISFQNLCNEAILFKQYEHLNLLIPIKFELMLLCLNMFNIKFNNTIEIRNQHEQFTSNDCFTVLQNKHEFIGYYDLDEFVFPRNFDKIQNYYIRNETAQCNNLSSICNLNLFAYNFIKPNGEINDKERNYLYNYLHYLVEYYGLGRNISELGSITFPHAGYIAPYELEKDLIHGLRVFVEMVESDNITLPNRYIYFESKENYSSKILIEKDDINYIKQLYTSYNALVPCLKEKYLNHSINLNKNLVRYLFYGANKHGLRGKAIHYYKNIKTIRTHFAFIYKSNDSWDISPLLKHGHFLSHFRDDMSKIYTRDRLGSIRDLNIDYEYLFYLLRNYTNFCN